MKTAHLVCVFVCLGEVFKQSPTGKENALIMGVESGGTGGRVPHSREFWGDVPPEIFLFLHYLFKSSEK